MLTIYLHPYPFKYSESAELMKNSIIHQGAEIAQIFFGKKPKRKGTDMEPEFDFEDEFEREQDRRLAIHMGDEFPAHEGEPESGASTLGED